VSARRLDGKMGNLVKMGKVIDQKVNVASSMKGEGAFFV
jgi:hypothetical protein